MLGVYTPMNVPVRNTKVTRLSCISKQKIEKKWLHSKSGGLLLAISYDLNMEGEAWITPT